MDSLRNYFNWCLLLIPNIIRFVFHLSLEDWMAILSFGVMLLINSRQIISEARYWYRVYRFKRHKRKSNER
jgi:hypothetical protein